MPRGVYQRRPGMGNFGKTHTMRASVVRRWKAGMSYRDISLRFGISEWSVWKILHNADWNKYRGGKAPIMATTEPPKVVRAHLFTPLS